MKVERALSDEASRLRESLPMKLQRAMDLGSEKGASSWLVALPIEDEHNFTLPKGSLRDADTAGHHHTYHPTGLWFSVLH